MRAFLAFVLLGCGWLCQAAETVPLTLPAEISASSELIRRTVPAPVADRFFGELIPAMANGNDVFEIEAVNGRIVLRGNRPVAIASAFNHYLKHIAKCQVSWCGNQLTLPEPLPLPKEKIRLESPYKHAFAFNYCTFSYTMAWWDWARWEREIDFMALNGVDMPLAITGSETLWINFLTRFGYTRDQAKAFVCGPAYNAWWLMGNLEGRGGPVTDAWIESRVELQKKILARMRRLGMHPVLPGFVGLVPNNLPQIRPGTRILDQGQWCADKRPAVLHPDDPLFDEMGKAWYEELDKLYGKADAFAGDLFHEGGKTHGLNVPAIATRVQKQMLDYNPQSTWTLQGWGGNPRADLLKGLKKENTLVVELCCEFWRNWEKSQGFQGTPWIFSTVNVYGGNIALHGRLPAIAENLTAALNSPTPPCGLGMTWESIESNPIVIDGLWDMRWRKVIPKLDDWVGDYTVRRYGADLPQVRAAWQTIVRTAYGAYPDHRRPTESIFCAKPSLNITKASPFAASITVHYDQRQFRDAIKQLLEAAPQCGKQATYRYDIVDLTRQFLANAAQIPYREMVAAVKVKDKTAFDKASAEFLAMLDDQDRLLGTEKLFLLGKWLDDARRCAATPEQALQNEQNARWLITTWTREHSMLGDYAWREWNGLLRNYYRPRWEWFIQGHSMNLKGIMVKRLPMEALETRWTAKTWDNDPYPVEPQGDGLAITKELLAKWGPMLDDPKRYAPPAKYGKAGQEEAAESGR
jgi:alpha-N-acetylglucosaminidase